MSKHLLPTTCAFALLAMLAARLALVQSGTLSDATTTLVLTPTVSVYLPALSHDNPPVCYCHADLYRCADFDTQADAQRETLVHP